MDKQLYNLDIALASEVLISEGYGTEAVHEKVADTRLESLNAAR